MNKKTTGSFTQGWEFTCKILKLPCWPAIALALVFIFQLLHASPRSVNILFLKSNAEPYYSAVVTHVERYFENICATTDIDCNKLTMHSLIADDSQPIDKNYTLVVTLGLSAREYAENFLHQTPTINAMVPRRTIDTKAILPTSRKKLTLVLDQPLSRNLFLIKRIIHPKARVGILLSPSTQSEIDFLEKEARITGLQIVSTFIESDKEIGKKLSQLLNEIDVLLAQPDRMIYNRKTISQILLSSYRNNIPVIGYSAAYVNAGALAAVYSSPEDIGNDIGMIITNYLTRNKLNSGIVHPSYFSISVNENVRNSLGIALDLESKDIAEYIKEHTQ